MSASFTAVPPDAVAAPLPVRPRVTGPMTGVVCGKSGDEIEAKTALSLAAGTGFSAKARTGIELDAGTALNAKAKTGATVDGGGMLTVKGGMVKIN